MIKQWHLFAVLVLFGGLLSPSRLPAIPNTQLSLSATPYHARATSMPGVSREAFKGGFLTEMKALHEQKQAFFWGVQDLRLSVPNSGIIRYTEARGSKPFAHLLLLLEVEGGLIKLRVLHPLESLLSTPPWGDMEQYLMQSFNSWMEVFESHLTTAAK